jgi:hypothetical protein
MEVVIYRGKKKNLGEKLTKMGYIINFSGKIGTNNS